MIRAYWRIYDTIDTNKKIFTYTYIINPPTSSTLLSVHYRRSLYFQLFSRKEKQIVNTILLL